MSDTATPASLPRLAAAIARQTGLTEEFCEKFVLEMFRVAESGLQRDRRVAIKGLGVFVLDMEGNVSFKPEAEVAEDINEPFACFSPVAIDPDVDPALLDGETGQAAISSSPDEKTEEIGELSEPTVRHETEVETSDSGTVAEIPSMEGVGEEIPEPLVEDAVSEATIQPEPEPMTAPEPERNPEPMTAPEPLTEPEAETAPASSDEFISAKNSGAPKPILWFVAGIAAGIVIGALATWWILREASVNPQIVAETLPEPEIQLAETSAQQATEIEACTGSGDCASEQESGNVARDPQSPQSPETDPPVVTETVTPGNFLAAMSRRHYGRYEFWVYIYEENKDILGHPDRVEKGTVLVIPPADKYGIDRNSQQSVAAAEALARDIYARFN